MPLDLFREKISRNPLDLFAEEKSKPLPAKEIKPEPQFRGPEQSFAVKHPALTAIPPTAGKTFLELEKFIPIARHLNPEVQEQIENMSTPWKIADVALGDVLGIIPGTQGVFRLAPYLRALGQAKRIEQTLGPTIGKGISLAEEAIKAPSTVFGKPIGQLVKRGETTITGQMGKEAIEKISKPTVETIGRTAPEDLFREKMEIPKPPKGITGKEIRGLPSEEEKLNPYLEYLFDEVKRGEFISRQPKFNEQREIIGWLKGGSTYPDFMRNQGWTKKEVIIALEKGFKGQKLTTKQQNIFDAAKSQANELYDNDLWEKNIRIEQEAGEFEEIPFSVGKYATGEEPFKLTAPKGPTFKKPLPKQLDLFKAQAKIPTTGLRGKGAVEELEFIKKQRELEAKKAQKDLFGKPSLGQYAVGAQATPPSIPSGLKALDMPETVEFFNELSQGKYPTVHRKLKQVMGMSPGGVYKTGKSEIKLLADIFKDPAQSKATLAHEIGHFVDDLPDYLLKARGNLLGRVGSFKNYLKELLEGYPGSPNKILEQADKDLLLQEARRQAHAGVKTSPEIAPEDVINIWNNVVDLKPDLTNYVKTLNNAQKKELLNGAFKGSFPPWFNFGAVEPILGTKIKEIYANLIEEEIRRRGLFKLSDIQNELKALSKEWRPWDEVTASPSMKAYRNRGSELYADAISVLLNNPGMLEQKAPTFYKALFSWIEKKPKIKQTYEDIQTLLTKSPEELIVHREERIKKEWSRGEEIKRGLFEERQKPRKTLFQELSEGLIDKNRKLYEVGKRGGEAGKRAIQKIEEQPYVVGEVYSHLNKVEKNIFKPLLKNKISKDDLDLYVFYNMISKAPKDIARPMGQTRETAIQGLQAMQKRLGSDKFAQIEKAQQQYWQYRKENVFPLLEEAGMYDNELMTLIKNNENYARTSVVDYLAKNYGSENAGKIYKQYGTLRGAGRAFNDTVMKDTSLIRAAEANIAKKKWIDLLTQEGLARPSERKFTGKYTQFIAPKDSTKDNLIFLEKGKIQSFDMDKDLAEIIKHKPHEVKAIANLIVNSQMPVKSVLVSHNPLWMVGNLIKDFMGTATNIPEFSIFKLPKYYFKSVKDAYLDSFHKIQTPYVQKMYKEKKLVVGRSYRPKDLDAELEFERMLQSFGESPEKYHNFVVRPFMKLWDLTVGTLGRTGQFTERWAKIAGSKYLEEVAIKTGRTPGEIAQLVRTRIGTPDIYRKGKWHNITNNLFMFSNVGKEGWRSYFISVREAPGTTLLKTVTYDLVPKTIMKLTEYGIMGSVLYGALSRVDPEGAKRIREYFDQAQDILKKVSPYYKNNYQVVPLGYDARNEPVFLTIPQSYSGQIISGFWNNVLDRRITEQGGALDIAVSGQPYGLNPWVSSIRDLATYYLLDVNPIDYYRQTMVLDPDVATVGGKNALIDMAKHVANTMGFSTIHRFDTTGLKRVKSEFEKMLVDYPGKALSRFLRVGSQGEFLDYLEILHDEDKKAAKKRVTVETQMADTINQINEQGGQHAIAAKNLYNQFKQQELIDEDKTRTQFYKSYLRMLGKTKYDNQMRALLLANTTDKQAALLVKFHNELKPEEWNGLLAQVIGEGHVHVEGLMKTVEGLFNKKNDHQ